LAKASKETNKAPKKQAVTVKKVLRATAPTPPEPPKPSAQQLAQEALDLLGSANPSVTSGGAVVRWVNEGSYNRVNELLVAIVNE
jgi:hypothetical protein|tara:strand:- start:603 stop:857 length:255 start_codon:yes stop_codon:yes gene_type:complete